MMRRDDSSLTPQQTLEVRREARRVLEAADAIGRLPTPVHDVMDAARVEELPEDILDEGFLLSMRKRAGDALKRAVHKVIGLFDAQARVIVLDRSIHEKKQVFVRLHETGHASLPWHRDAYALVEDSEQTIRDEIADLFEREANVFASEVLFQLDAFAEETSQHDFGITVPLRLGRKYGASAYASIRRYVSGNHRACAVLVLEPPEFADGIGFRCRVRRTIVSSRFREIFGEIQWSEGYTPSDPIGAAIPVNGRKMSAPRSIVLPDSNGEAHECVVEGFNSTYQVFVLVLASETLRPTTVIMPGSR